VATATKRKTSRKPLRSKSKARPAKARKPKSRAKPARRPAAKPKTRKPAADDMRALARRIVAVTLANDDEATLALYAADVESSEPGQPPLRGVDALRQKFTGWRNMVSEAHFEPRRVCVDGNTIVVEWDGRATLAGSGKTVAMHEVAIHEIRDGKIAREAYFYDPSVFAS
jgi:ketosteroid isomerase-like protein